MRIRNLFHPGSRYRMEKFVSGINIPDPQHWTVVSEYGHDSPSWFTVHADVILLAQLHIVQFQSVHHLHYIPQ